MKYVYRETELSKKYQNIYLNARKDGNEILCYIGIDKRYRIYTKDSYYENISDMDALLELCIYPIYINGCHEIEQEVKNIITSMTNSNDILQIYQVFNLIMSQEIETKMYTEIPFEIDFADCIPCLLKKKNEFMNQMKNYNQNGFDKYRENIWDNIEKICRKSTLIQQCNM